MIIEECRIYTCLKMYSLKTYEEVERSECTFEVLYDLNRIPENIHIGSSISGYIVFGIWNDFCIAENPNPPSFNPLYHYCIWRTTPNEEGVYVGHLFETRAEAEKEFFRLVPDAEPNKNEYWKR